MILSNKTLYDIASIRPGSTDELIKAHGVGPYKVEQYGNEILYWAAQVGPRQVSVMN